MGSTDGRGLFAGLVEHVVARRMRRLRTDPLDRPPASPACDSW